MGEFTARRGEWEIVEDNSVRHGITGRRRTRAVTFSPSASSSRLHFNETGKRYEVRLTADGRVQIRTGGTEFTDLRPARDPLTNRALSPGVTYRRNRRGKRIEELPRFDMIATGRGRIFARVEGTDRFFHLKLDELFRTAEVRDEEGRRITVAFGDPPVPSTFITLDPEFYEGGNDASNSPDIFEFDFGRHPGSLRFGLFRLAMTAGAASSDFVVVAMRPRVWYELESRPPLKVFDFRDVLDISAYDIRRVLLDHEDLLTRIIATAIGGQPLLRPVADLLRPIIDDIARRLATPIRDKAVQTRPSLEGLVGLAIAGAAGVLLRLTAPVATSPRTARRPVDFSNKLEDLKIRLALIPIALSRDENRPLNRFIEALVAVVRDERGATIPNAPPADLPRYTHVRYRAVPPRLPPGVRIPEETADRLSIDFSEVLDLGVGYSHWHEHWHAGYGGEIHSLLATRPIAQQEGLNSILYRFLNGPVLDGDGYNDGTTNFYILVRLRTRRARFAILWIDEQTYFSQRWRLVHPTADIRGDLFSLARTLDDHPEYFRFNLSQYWDPFEQEGFIDGKSRMAVARQTIAVTGRDPQTRQREIYTFAFNYGVSDRTWRWRPMPPARVRMLDEADIERPTRIVPNRRGDEVFANTLGLREDLTLHMRGVITLSNGERRAGRWFQRVLPSNLDPVPKALDLTSGKPSVGYSHDWQFFSDSAWADADRMLVLGAYESRVTSRCQYYSVEIGPDENGRFPAAGPLTGRVWQNVSAKGQPPLSHNTENFSWDLGTDSTGAIDLEDLLESRRERASMSMYEDVTRFRLLDRGRRGLIAVYFDPRDDELQAASHLPQRVTLTRDDGVTIEDPFVFRPPRLEPLPSAPRRLNVTFKSHTRVLRPPMVRKVRLVRRIVNGVTESVLISFWSMLGDDEITENLWQIAIGAPAPNEPIILFRSECFGPFRRVAPFVRPISFDASEAEQLADDRRFDFRWTGFDETERLRIEHMCTPDGRVRHGTSIWFKDIVGHLGTPESVELKTE